MTFCLWTWHGHCYACIWYANCLPTVHQTTERIKSAQKSIKYIYANIGPVPSGFLPAQQLQLDSAVHCVVRWCVDNFCYSIPCIIGVALTLNTLLLLPLLRSQIARMLIDSTHPQTKKRQSNLYVLWTQTGIKHFWLLSNDKKREKHSFHKFMVCNMRRNNNNKNISNRYQSHCLHPWCANKIKCGGVFVVVAMTSRSRRPKTDNRFFCCFCSLSLSLSLHPNLAHFDGTRKAQHIFMMAVILLFIFYSIFACVHIFHLTV